MHGKATLAPAGVSYPCPPKEGFETFPKWQEETYPMSELSHPPLKLKIPGILG